MEEEKFDYINIEDCFVSSMNIRKSMFRLDELISSIKNVGLIDPIIVRPSDAHKNKKWEVIAGQRRYLATKDAKQEKIKALIMNVDDEKAILISLSENLQKEEVDPIDIANGIKKLIGLEQKKTGCNKETAEENVARKLGKTIRTIKQYLDFLGTTDEIKNTVSKGRLGVSDTSKFVSELEPEEQKFLAETIEEENLTKTKTRKLLQYTSKKPKNKFKSSVKEFVEEQVIPITLNIPNKIFKKLDSYAQEHNTEVEELALKILKEWVAKNG